MNTPWLSLALTGALTTWFLIAAMSPSFPGMVAHPLESGRVCASSSWIGLWLAFPAEPP